MKANDFSETRVVEQAGLAWLEGARLRRIAWAGDCGRRTRGRTRGPGLPRRCPQRAIARCPRPPKSRPASSMHLEDAFRQTWTRADAPSLIERNRASHTECSSMALPWSTAKGGVDRRSQVCVLDFDAPENNDWAAVNQFTVARTSTSAGRMRRFSSTGCRSAVIELKNAAD